MYLFPMSISKILKLLPRKHLVKALYQTKQSPNPIVYQYIWSCLCKGNKINEHEQAPKQPHQ